MVAAAIENGTHPQEQGKLIDGSLVGYPGRYLADPEPYHTFGELDGGSVLLHEKITKIEDIVFTGQPEPVAQIVTPLGEFPVPTSVDLELIKQDAHVENVSQLPGSNVVFIDFGVFQREPFGIRAIPRPEVSTSAAD